MTVWLGSPSKNTVAVLSRYTKTGAANNTQLKYIPQQTKGCFYIRQEPITKQSSRNKTRCPDGQDCVVVINKNKIVTTRSNICWIVINKLRPTLFILGSIAMVLNITVLGTVLRVGSLRKSPPFLLVSHLGFCDTLVGIYSMGIALGHGFSFKEFNDWKEIYCPALRSIFIFAEVTGSLTSLLMTAERYLAIVFCMKPAARLGHKVIAAALAFAWIAGASSATVVQMLDKRNNQTDGQMCLIIRNTFKTSTIYASELILLVLVFLYFVVVVLYFHIFIVVRRSARNMGVLRESRLAKRISAIVLSSFFFFAAPNCTTVSFIFRGGNVFEDARLNKTIIWWLPPVCLVVNACLDPCLFAFRNEKFFRALTKVACRHPFGRLLTKNRPARKDPHTAYNSALNLTAHSRSDLSSSIELTSFSTTDISKA